MARSSLPPGFRFHPTDVELVCYYLKRKVIGKPFHFDAIQEIELYKFAPWDLPEKSQLFSKDLEWYFLCPRDRKYPNGSRTNRTTDIGYWKATGKDRFVEYDSCIIGMKKTLIFHVGKPPRGDRTDWVMYEYRLEDKEVADAGFSQDAYVLCKIFKKSGLGPKIGEQYGAPFNEADWEDDANNVVSPFLSCSSSKILHDQAISSAPVLQQPITSDVVEDPSDPDLSFVDGLLVDDLVELLRSPVENTNVKVSDTVLLCEDNAESSTVDYEAMCNELLEGASTETVVSDSSCHVDNIQIGYPFDSMASEICSSQYLELNDLSFLGESDTCKSLMQDCLLEQHPSYQSPSLHYLDNNIHLSNADIAFVSDSFPGGSEANLNATSPCSQADFYCDFWNC